MRDSITITKSVSKLICKFKSPEWQKQYPTIAMWSKHSLQTRTDQVLVLACSWAIWNMLLMPQLCQENCLSTGKCGPKNLRKISHRMVARYDPLWSKTYQKIKYCTQQQQTGLWCVLSTMGESKELISKFLFLTSVSLLRCYDLWACVTKFWL